MSLPPCRLGSVNVHLGSWPATALVPVQLETSGPVVWCKLEYMHPGGSTKDRIARHILTKAWRSGIVKPGSWVIEASSGSTSIAMAMVCAQLGLRFIAVMPEGVSSERSLMIKAYGGAVRFAPAERGMVGCLALTHELAKELDGFLPRQFENEDNAAAHRFGTAIELIGQLPAQHADAIVAGVGTGGTLVGIYHGLRDHGCAAKPFAARPVATGDKPLAMGCFDHAECSSFSKRIPGVIEGMSRLYQPDQLDGLETIEVSDTHALEVTRALIKEGFPVGPSSGLNYAAAVTAYEHLEKAGLESPIVATVFCDRMERYFSTELFAGG